MSSDEQTKPLDTKPTIETVLERINQLGEQLSGDIASLRTEMQKEFRQIQRQFDRILGELSRQHAIIDDHEDRFQKLEEKAS
jgi:hypothetical protein